MNVTFDVDANGILSVNASDEASGPVAVHHDHGGQGRQIVKRRDVERMIADAEAHASDDAAMLDKARARNDLEGACYSARSTLSKHASDDVSAAQSEVDDALKLNENNDADADAVRKRQQARRCPPGHRSGSKPNENGEDDADADAVRRRVTTGATGQAFDAVVPYLARDPDHLWKSKFTARSS